MVVYTQAWLHTLGSQKQPQIQERKKTHLRAINKYVPWMKIGATIEEDGRPESRGHLPSYPVISASSLSAGEPGEGVEQGYVHGCETEDQGGGEELWR